MFCIVLVLLSECRSEVLQDENNDDDDDDYDDEDNVEERDGGEEEENEEGEKDGEEGKEDANDDYEEEEAKRIKETEQETEERNELKSINAKQRQRESKEQEIERHRRQTTVNADAFEQTGTNLTKLRNEIENLKNKYCSEFTTRCYQLKLHLTTDVDHEKVIRKSHESSIVKPVLDNIKLIEDQWRTLDLWDIVHSLNPRPPMKFDRDELFKTACSTPIGNKEDMIFRKSIVLCSIFESHMRTLGLKVGDTHDIEEDICDVIGQMLMKVEKQDRSSLLDCMQSAILHIPMKDSIQDGGKLRTLLIRKKKYNGSNLACILLEQMILDTKDNNVSWMRIVSAQFIDLVVQLIIEPDYQEDVHWTLNYLLKLESEWIIADVYTLLKNGLLMFHGKQKKFLGFSVFPDNQKKFRRYLMIIRNFALHPSLYISSTKKKKPVDLKDILYSRDENVWRYLNEVVSEKESEKSVDQVLGELKEDEIGHEKDTIQQIIAISQTMLNKNNAVREYPAIIERELDRIRKAEQKNGVDLLSSCLAVTSMALYISKKYWPLNTQLVSYCLLVTHRTNEKGRLLEILTGEGKSCVIAMVAATYALQGRTVDIVTSSPVLSERDAEEWRKFYSMMKLEAGCNVEDRTKEDTTCYECPIVYGTVETFARDILKTEFLINDVRKGRKCDSVIVDEVDSMLLDQGVQCTYLSHDVPSVGLGHFDPVLALIWMHVNSLTPVILEEGIIFYALEPEIFLVTLSRLRNGFDPLQILRLAEEDEEVRDIKKGFTDEYLSKNVDGQGKILSSDHSFAFFVFARKVMHLDIDIYLNLQDFISDSIQRNDRSRISIIVMDNGLVSVVCHYDMIKNQLKKLITKFVLSDKNESKIDLPIYLKNYCVSRLQCWIDNAFLAKEMQPFREYIVDGDEIYPVDFKSTGVVETNKKWGDGLQQFLEMKHGLPFSPLSLITNFLSNIDFLERYGSNIVGVTGTLGDEHEKQFMRDIFSVEFATIPASKRRKLFVLDEKILEDKKAWLIIISEKVKSAVESQRAVLVICEDIATADEIHKLISKSETKPYSLTKGGGYDGGHKNKKLKPMDVVIATNLGARGTDFVTDDAVNKNGGLFVLVTFIPLNGRVEKQAFGRTGRRGATGSCQIIVNRKTMPEWARQCETVDEVKRLRDSIEMYRLNNITEVDMMREKQKLFREYCKLKNNFFASNASDTDDLKIQGEILDETWAKWIQEVETRVLVMEHAELIDELRRKITDCSYRAKRFDSENMYSILKFGAVRLMEGDFGGAIKFYDRVIGMDPEWSAFAHYNRAYCTLQMKGDGYIRRAIHDLNATLDTLETYKTSFWFSEIHVIASTTQQLYMRGDDDDSSEVRVKSNNRRSTKFHTMLDCLLLHHIDKQINETIEKLETIETMKEEVKIMKQDILELIPGADCKTVKMLQKYQQLGLLFTFNIDEKQTLCYMNETSSLLEILDEFIFMTLSADIIWIAFCNLIPVTGSSMELRDTLYAFLNKEGIGLKSQMRIQRCVQRAIINGIILSNLFRDVSSLIPITQNELESSYEKNEATSQFKHFVQSETPYIYGILNSWLGISKDDFAILIYTTDIALDILRKKIEQTIRDKMKPGQALYRELCCLYNSVTSTSSSDPQQYADYIRDLAQLPVYSSQFSDADMCTSALQNVVDEMMSIYRLGGISAADLARSEITAAAEKIEVGIVITQFSDLLCGMVNVLSQRTKADGYDCGDVHMLKVINKVLTSAWSEIIRGMLKNRIIRSVFPKIQVPLEEIIVSKCRNLYQYRKGHTKLIKQNTIQYKHNPLPDLSTRLKKYYNEMKKSGGPHVQLKTDARMVSEHLKRNIIILDVNREAILTISSHDNRESIELIYNPPCPAYPGGHFDAHVDGKVVEATIIYNDDNDMLYSAIRVAMGRRFFIGEYFDEHPSEGGLLISSVNYASQLKRGRALLRFDANPPTRQMNPYVGIDSPHLSSCIEQPLKSENLSQLAKVLAEYESEMRSYDVNSSEHGTEILTSPVSRDACTLFVSSGSSVEAEVFRQLVVENINDGDITTAIKLCCICHQIPLVRNDSNQPISDAETLRDTFERMLKIESYKPERFKFLSICDEWYRVFEPRGLMNIGQRELLREWISTRQYANTEDPIVSLVIEKCSKPKKEEEKKKWREAEKMREEEEKRKWQEAKKIREKRRGENGKKRKR